MCGVDGPRDRGRVTVGQVRVSPLVRSQPLVGSQPAELR
jgi:hypothetical protein